MRTQFSNFQVFPKGGGCRITSIVGGPSLSNTKAYECECNPFMVMSTLLKRISQWTTRVHENLLNPEPGPSAYGSRDPSGGGAYNQRPQPQGPAPKAAVTQDREMSQFRRHSGPSACGRRNLCAHHWCLIDSTTDTLSI